MKKLVSLVLALMLVVSMAAFAEKSALTVWTNGSQNVADLFNELVAVYNQKEDGKAIAELQHTLSGTGGEGLRSRVSAAFLTNQTNTTFDLIVENSSDFQTYFDECGTEDVLLDIDKSQVVGYDELTVVPMFANKIVPYRCTTVVFAYDETRIPAEELPHTWDELAAWIHAHPGRFAYNEPDSGGAGKAFVQSAVYRLIEDKSSLTSPDPKWAEQYGAGIEWLVSIHPDLYKSGGNVLYPNKNQGSLDLLINQEVDMIPAWADQILSNMENGILPATTRMYQLDDTALSGSDVSMAIPSIGSNPEGAYDFISFVISPEGQKICLENMKAIPVIDAAKIESDQKALVEGLGGYNFISIGKLWSDYMYQTWMEEILPL